MQYYGQNREDEVAMKYLPEGPAHFIDIGAGYPTEISNTYAFYLKGWRGLAVEPHDHYWSSWQVNRPEDVLVKEAISDHNGTLMMANTVAEGSFLYDIYVSQDKIVPRSVPCRTFADIMVQYPQFMDAKLLSLDVERHEALVMSTMDFKVFKPTLIIIEKQIRGQDSKPLWEHLLLPYYQDLNIDNTGNSFYLRR